MPFRRRSGCAADLSLPCSPIACSSSSPTTPFAPVSRTRSRTTATPSRPPAMPSPHSRVSTRRPTAWSSATTSPTPTAMTCVKRFSPAASPRPRCSSAARRTRRAGPRRPRPGRRPGDARGCRRSPCACPRTVAPSPGGHADPVRLAAAGPGDACRPGRAWRRRAHPHRVPRARGAARAARGRHPAGRLVGAAWPADATVSDNSLDQYIARLRAKLDQVSGGSTIVTTRGVGYRLE